MENSKLKIPLEFKILGKTIKVEFKDEYCNGEGIFGEADYVTNTIKLSNRTRNKEVTQDNIEHTYLHEVVHHILQAMGETELNNSEKFVDLFSGILHQVLTTSKYGE